MMPDHCTPGAPGDGRADAAPPEGEDRHVFVYGTLRRGECNDINRLAPPPVFRGFGRVAGRLFDLGAYPALQLGAPGWVIGEVYRIDAALEPVLDRIEGVDDGDAAEYDKAQVAVVVQGSNGGHSCACLVYAARPSATVGRPLVEGGDWVHHRTSRITKN